MNQSTQSRPTAWRPPPSIIFPVCVITVALSAISPAASVARGDLGAPARAVAVRLVPEAHSHLVDEGRMQALDAGQPPLVDPTE
jgi:hypothetical protein